MATIFEYKLVAHEPEKKIIMTVPEAVEWLNSLGKEGWELVARFEHPPGGVAFWVFKREIHS